MIAIIGLATALSLATCTRNAWVYGNPFYPIATNIIWPLPGPWKEYRNYPTYTKVLGFLARPANWLLSITEVDWLIRGVSPVYLIDMHAGDAPGIYSRARTGGFGGGLVTGSIVLAVALLVRTRRCNAGALAKYGFFFSSFLFLTALTAFMPQSHELRYYLYWPILLLVGIGILMNTSSIDRPGRLAICVIYLACFIGTELFVRAPDRRAPLRVFPIYSPERDTARFAGSPVVEHARRNGGPASTSPIFRKR